MTPSRLAKGRGYRWEVEAANAFGAERTNAGPGIDLRLGETIIEAKSRQSYAGMRLLIEWITQAAGYAPDWVLAVRLGLRSAKVTFAVMPIERAAGLLKLEREHAERVESSA